MANILANKSELDNSEDIQTLIQILTERNESRFRG